MKKERMKDFSNIQNYAWRINSGTHNGSDTMLSKEKKNERGRRILFHWFLDAVTWNVYIHCSVV